MYTAVALLCHVARRRVNRSEVLFEVLEDYSHLAAEQKAEIIEAVSGR